MLGNSLAGCFWLEVSCEAADRRWPGTAAFQRLGRAPVDGRLTVLCTQLGFRRLSGQCGGAERGLHGLCAVQWSQPLRHALCATEKSPSLRPDSGLAVQSAGPQAGRRRSFFVQNSHELGQRRAELQAQLRLL